MILVDTSVWIDHLQRGDAELAALLEQDEVVVHPFVVEELALGSIARRETVLALLADLRSAPVLWHEEVLALVEARRLWGQGLGATDAHLLGSALVVPGLLLWTRDRRLAEAAQHAGVAYA